MCIRDSPRSGSTCAACRGSSPTRPPATRASPPVDAAPRSSPFTRDDSSAAGWRQPRAPLAAGSTRQPRVWLWITSRFETLPERLPAGPVDEPVDYVALGDSYSSRVGTGVYDAPSGDCFRSPLSYPPLWVAERRTASFGFAACSGARTDDVLANQVTTLQASTGPGDDHYRRERCRIPCLSG